MNSNPSNPDSFALDSRASWRRLITGAFIGTAGSIGMWSFVVALPEVQKDFGVTRAEVSSVYILAMTGFALGGVMMGRLYDRHGLFGPLIAGALLLAGGYLAAAQAPNVTVFALAHFVLGVGTSASFAPLMTDISMWFDKRRGIAVALASCGNYLAGTLWPPLMQYSISAWGWRTTHMIIAIACLAALLPLAFMMRERAPRAPAGAAMQAPRFGAINMPPNTLMILLAVAGVACCVAMAMPQVHIVAYCVDLKYGAARGAEMLSVMLGFGIISRIAAGLIADRIGALSALLISSSLQGVALFLYLFFDSMTSLFVISALFGLFQGGIVPMYAVIVREYFPAARAGSVTGVIIMATLFGMAFGGWVSGYIFDKTGSYHMAFFNGLMWNFLNVAIVVFLLVKSRGAPAARTAAA